MFSPVFPQLRKMRADKNRKTLFDVNKQVFLTPAVMFLSFRKSPVVHRSTNRNGP